MLRAASYSRFSTDMQNATSIEDQNRICEERIKMEGWQLTVPYSDYALSGASMERPGLKRMMADAAAGAFDILVVEGLDRISRDAEHMAGIYKRLSFHGVKIYSLVDGGFVSDIHIAFGGAKNALFLKDLAFKVKRGMKGRVGAGKSLSKKVYGYEIVRRFDANGEPVRGERAIKESDAAIVRRIFEAYASGQGAQRIARELNQEGVPSPTGGQWSSTYINGWRAKGRGLLNNELYIGRIIWNRHSYLKDPDTEKRSARPNATEEWAVSEVPELRIIDQALWDKVKARQDELAAKQEMHQKRRPKYLLSYLLKCGCCGGGFAQISQTFYGCSRARYKGTCDNRKGISKLKLENAVLDAIERQLLKPELLAVFTKEYNKHLQQLQASQYENKESIKQRLQRLDGEKAKLVEAIKAGIPASELKDEFNRNAKQRAELSMLMEQFDKPVANTLAPDMAGKFNEAIATFKDDAHGKGNDEAIDLIRRLVDKIVMTPNATTGKLDVQLFGDLAGLLASDANAVQSILNEPYLNPSENQQESNTMQTHRRRTSGTQFLRCSKFDNFFWKEIKRRSRPGRRRAGRPE